MLLLTGTFYKFQVTWIEASVMEIEYASDSRNVDDPFFGRNSKGLLCWDAHRV